MGEVRIEVRQPGRVPLQVVVVDQLELGRDCNGLLLADERVSRSHAVLVATADGIEVIDLASTNGTFVNATRIDGPTALAAGDELVLGDTTVAVMTTAPRAAPSPSPSMVRETVALTRVPSLRPSEPDADSETRVVKPAAGKSEGIRTSIDLLAAEVQGEASTLGASFVDGTVTILFSDIEMSTALAERLGDARWLQVLRDHNDLVRRLLVDHRGREIKAQGDGFMLAFPSARCGINFAVDLQRALHLHASRHPEKAVRVRIGLHTGDALADEGDIFGKHVIQSARIAAIAEGAQILVSSLTYQLATGAPGLSFGPEQNVELKGLAGTFGVREALWWEHATPNSGEAG